MKLTIALLTIVFLQVSAKTNSQTISYSCKNTSLKKVFSAVESQTGYVFFYKAATLRKAKPVSLQLNNTTLEMALKEICKGQPFTCSVVDKTITLTQKEIETPKQQPLVTGEISLQPPILIKGKVTDENGKPFARVSVLVKGTNYGTTTDENGEFNLNVKDNNAILIISYVGYATQEINIKGRINLDIVLNAVVQKQQDIVVVGYGTQKKVNVTGSISTIDKKFLADRPITNSSQALQGVSGVHVNQGNGGQPGADAATINIRGIGTLNNNNPLILVDGIPYNLRDVNPNDIESITTLKDAAAASIYGNRAANGVILIKTKSGVRGKTQIEYDNYFGTQEATYLPNTLTNSFDVATLYNEALINQGNPAQFTTAQLDSFKIHSGNDSKIYTNTDWNKIMFHNAFMQQHNLRFSGGDEKMLYSLSLGYLNQDGVLLGTNGKRYSLSTNLSFDVSKNLKVGLNLSGSYWSKNESPLGIAGLMNLTYRALSFQAPTLDNGSYADQWFVLKGQGVFRNPYALAMEGNSITNTTDILANVFAEYQLPLKIKYKINYGITKEDDYTDIFIPNIYQYNPVTGASSLLDWLGLPRSAQRLNTNTLNTTFYQTLNWNHIFGVSHYVNILLGNSAEDYYTAGSSGYVEGFIDNQVTELSNGTINQSVSSSTAENKLLSFFGRANYNFNEKYLAEFNFRYDGSSRFAPGHRWGFFPSFSAGWRMDKENFFQSINQAVSSLKLRGSWGQLGNQNIPNFAYQNTYVNTVPMGYGFGTNIQVGAAATQISNPYITWEKTTTTDIGIDAGFIKEKLLLTVDYYNRLTTGILTPVIIPAQVGNLTGPLQNLYSMRNDGVEVGLTYQNKIGQFTYHAGGSISFNNNKVVSLKGQQQISGNLITKEGYPVNSFYLLKATGIFQSKDAVTNHAYEGPKTQPGDLIYEDINGDSSVTTADRIVVGRSVPAYTYAFNLGFEVKGFDFSAFFQGVGKVNTYTGLNLATPFNNGAGITKEWLTDSWTPTNTKASLPRITTSTGYPQNFKGSTFWLKDASYLRLKNIQLGYTLPKTLLKKVGVTRMRLFLNGQNLLTFSKFKLVDPERVTTQSNIYSYPSVKMFTGGINLTF